MFKFHIQQKLITMKLSIFTALGIEGRHQFQNASLAAQLCRTWLERKGLFSVTT